MSRWTIDTVSKGFSRIPDAKWEVYFQALGAGMSRYKAATEAGISFATVDRLHNDPWNSTSGAEHYREWLRNFKGDVVPHHKLSPNAKRALRDFGYFRERYFGHISRPWHVEAANTVQKLLESPDKSWVVINVPPGTGKTTLFSHDIPAWLITRNRAIRCLIGTGAESTGMDYTVRLKSTFERYMPIEADETEVRLGLAKNAKACLVQDYGRYQPEGNGYWRNDKLVVAREGGMPAHQKEATVASYGRKSNFLGGRFNYNMWDDVVNDQNSRDADEQDKLARWWRNTAESRVEPGGILLLMGQRMSPVDLYRYAIDLRDISAGWDGHFEDDDEAINMADFDVEKLPRKYTHIVYKAHYDEKCKGSENPKAPHHHPDTAEAWPDGCLLDPRRLTQRDLLLIKHNDPQTYATVYQQEDTDPEQALVQPLWINGGTDRFGNIYPGCWDTERGMGQFPRNLAGDVYSVVTADPSPSNFWGVAWWAYQTENGYQHLVDLLRKKMGAPELLDWRHSTGTFTGLLEEWYQRSADQGAPISHVIVETNAAQKFLLQYDHAQRWASTRGVQLTSFQTQRNKTDPDYGIPSLGPEYKHGRVRLPGHPLAKPYVMPLYTEVTRYPVVATTDCLMTHFFLRWTAAQQFVPRQAQAAQFARPTWIRDRHRGIRGVA